MTALGNAYGDGDGPRLGSLRAYRRVVNDILREAEQRESPF